MHAIKKAARRQAWYSNPDDEVHPFNPFARTRTGTNRNVRDLEQGGNTQTIDTSANRLQHTQTENNAVSPVEEERHKINEEGRSPFEKPQKSNTFAGAGTRTDQRGYLSPDAPISNLDDSKSGIENEANSRKDQDIPERSPESHVDEKQPRKRKVNFLTPWKKEEESDQPNHTDTDDSKKKKNYPKLTVWSQVRVVLFSWINLLLVFVPIGIALNYANVNGVIVFVLNFIAIIPLAAMLSFATEELALYIGETLGGLLNATFGNAVELIVGVIALVKKEILIVQTSLIGSMLSNLLLVLGMCFFFGGLRRVEQHFNIVVAQTGASLLALAIGALVIPTAFKIFENKKTGAAPLSRGTAVLLLVTYICYLVFQLRTHVDIYNEPSKKSPKKPKRRKSAGEAIKGFIHPGGSSSNAPPPEVTEQDVAPDEDVQEEEEEEIPQLTKVGALVTLAGSTVLVALCAEFMVGAISSVAESVSPEFIGLILLPIVGNAAEHATAVTVAIKDKMDLAIGVAVGSSLQIALLVLPLMVLFSWWGVGQPGPDMTLSFDGFQVVVLFIAIIVVNYLIQDGKSHWLEGVLLQITYLIIALAAWFYPTNANLAG